MIDIHALWHHYDVHPILRGVTLRISEGELVVIMGPNGMGKSTLLKLVAGLLWPQKGYVEIAGNRRRRTAQEENEARKRVVYLPAEPWMPSHLTVRQYVVYVGRVYAVEDARLFEHVDRLFRLFELDDKQDAPIAACSTGQRKKVALCGVLASEAPVLVLDEPFSGGLDPSGIYALKRVLGHLAARKDVTVLMASPVPELAEAIAHRVAILHNGELVACDSPAALRERVKSGPLQEAYEALVHQESLDHVEAYFRQEQA